ncbi:hypothetical protein BD410DRAFT_781163 [Rickenella mellea]|uniref:Uncharacterized protein n=1 Tax=Rickenella mellea TaxID=50990 RepID=A0A4Y7QLX7_9AGAM|nr:hypothetical protein BD410DRAFT_781163 [Rickenella mellea]
MATLSSDGPTLTTSQPASSPPLSSNSSPPSVTTSDPPSETTSAAIPSTTLYDLGQCNSGTPY